MLCLINKTYKQLVKLETKILNTVMPRSACAWMSLQLYRWQEFNSHIFSDKKLLRDQTCDSLPLKIQKKTDRQILLTSKIRLVHFVPITGRMLHYSFHLGGKDKFKQKLTHIQEFQGKREETSTVKYSNPDTSNAPEYGWKKCLSHKRDFFIFLIAYLSNKHFQFICQHCSSSKLP